MGVVAVEDSNLIPWPSVVKVITSSEPNLLPTSRQSALPYRLPNIKEFFGHRIGRILLIIVRKHIHIKLRLWNTFVPTRS